MTAAVRLSEIALVTFGKALAALERALVRMATSPNDEVIRDACIQRFEFTFDLAHKVLVGQIEHDATVSEETMAIPNRESFAKEIARSSLVDDAGVWIGFHDKRILAPHAHEFASAEDVFSVIPEFAVSARKLLQTLHSSSGAPAVAQALRPGN